MPTVYQNRQAFEFSEYFATLQRTAGIAKQRTEQSDGLFEKVPSPGAIFVASDSPRMAAAIATERTVHLERVSLDPESMPLPPILTVPATRGRFLTDFGSHTAAAGVCG
jgi:hypothetical protein